MALSLLIMFLFVKASAGVQDLKVLNYEIIYKLL